MRYVLHRSAGGYNISDVDKQWFHIARCFAPAMHYKEPNLQGLWFVSKEDKVYYVELVGSNGYIPSLTKDWFVMLNDFSDEGIAKELDV